MIFRSKWVICRFHVNLPGCIKKTSMLFSNFQLVSPVFSSPTSKVRLSDLHLTSEVFMNGWRAIGSTLPIKAKIHNYACHQYIYKYLQISTNHIYIQYQVKNNLLLTSMLLIIYYGVEQALRELYVLPLRSILLSLSPWPYMFHLQRKTCTMHSNRDLDEDVP